MSVLDELTEEDLVRILTEPKNALVKQFAKLFALDGVELHVTPDACRELATEAIKKGHRCAGSPESVGAAHA